MAEPKIADLLISGETLLTQAYRRGVTDWIALAREKAMRALAEPIEGEEDESPPDTEAPAALTGAAPPARPPFLSHYPFSKPAAG
jgi:hypothetical protein